MSRHGFRKLGVGQERDRLGVLRFIFLEGEEIDCEEAADTNNSDSLTLPDGLIILNFAFVANSPPPPAPFPDCGEDDTNILGCDFSETCAP